MSEKYIYMIIAGVAGYFIGKKAANGDSWYSGWFN